MKSALHKKTSAILFLAALLCVAFVQSCKSESSTEAWLRYAPLNSNAVRKESLPDKIVIVGDSIVLKTAQAELVQGIGQMLGVTLTSNNKPTSNSIVLGTFEELRKISPALSPPETMKTDGFWITRAKVRESECLVITAANDRGVLYGVFSFLGQVARGAKVASVNEFQQPYAPVRWVNQWDNLDGRIERGYGGRSIFFEDGKVRSDLTRAGQYARLLASVRRRWMHHQQRQCRSRRSRRQICGTGSPDCRPVPPLGRATFPLCRPEYSESDRRPRHLDPLDPRVAEWWRNKVDQIYREIPDFGGFVVKADSEGRSGPSAYGRTHADAANVITQP